MDIFEEHLGKFKGAQVKAFLSDITCGESCWNAREDVCRCECGGKNHGIHLRGGNAIRACRINGRRYELVSVGKHADLFKQAQELVKQSAIESGEAWFEDGKLLTKSNYTGTEKIIAYSVPMRLDSLYPYVLKYASLPQCLKWKELEYFECADDRDRYFKSPAILWKRADLVS